MTAPSRAILLSAGRGSRLGALTRERPKCLLRVAGRTLLRWQIDTLRAAGIADILVVTGFRDELVAAEMRHAADVRLAFNPFFEVADNLASLWLVRAAMDRDFLVLNGDTLVSAATVAALVAHGEAAINVTVARKGFYDADDMKVALADGRVRAIGKTLAPADTDAESIGMLSFRGDGPRLFVDALDRAMRDPGALGRWYLGVVDDLAREGHVAPVLVDGHDCAEVDFPGDLAAAEALARRWADVQAESAAPSVAISASR